MRLVVSQLEGNGPSSVCELRSDNASTMFPLASRAAVARLNRQPGLKYPSRQF